MSIHVDYDLDISEVPAECIRDCSSSGDVSDAVSYWREELDFSVNRENAIACLSGYGAWEDDELAAMTDDDIAERILWIACCNFSEQRHWEAENPGQPPENSSSGTSCFVLE